MITHFLDVDLAALKAALHFYETRPHLFAYYQSVETPVPSALQAIAAEATLPFYVVYYEDVQDMEARVVSLYEYPIERVA